MLDYTTAASARVVAGVIVTLKGEVVSGLFEGAQAVRTLQSTNAALTECLQDGIDRVTAGGQLQLAL
ncbi:hypothetical protein ACWD11_34875 [Streptomyces sp. NPDC002776]